jgi:hypothetical protein
MGLTVNQRLVWFDSIMQSQVDAETYCGGTPGESGASRFFAAISKRGPGGLRFDSSVLHQLAGLV